MILKKTTYSKIDLAQIQITSYEIQCNKLDTKLGINKGNWKLEMECNVEHYPRVDTLSHGIINHAPSNGMPLRAQDYLIN